MPFRGAMKACKRLQIDYAEAVVDFEFGHRMAVPVISGVVIATEHHDRLMEEIEKDEVERLRKEDEKRRKAALGKWRKFLMGLRIVERIRQEYGEIDENVSVFAHGSTKEAAGRTSPEQRDEDLAGGFLPEGYEEDEGEEEAPAYHASGFFPTTTEEDQAANGDLVMEDEPELEATSVEVKASSPGSKATKSGRHATPRRSTRSGGSRRGAEAE